MNLVLKTAATEEPVSLAEIMAHARVDDAGDSEDITGKILAARMHVEDLTNRALCTSTWQLYLRNWPGRTGWWNGSNAFVTGCWNNIPIPLGWTQSVTSITYTTTDGVVHTLDPAIYEVDAIGGEILLASGQSWPGGELKRANPICIEFVAGRAAVDVPQPLKAALMLLAAHWIRNREAVTIGRTTVESMPLKMAVDALIAPHTIWRF